jgi:hypothetical protein
VKKEFYTECFILQCPITKQVCAHHHLKVIHTINYNHTKIKIISIQNETHTYLLIETYVLTLQNACKNTKHSFLKSFYRKVHSSVWFNFSVGLFCFFFIFMTHEFVRGQRNQRHTDFPFGRSIGQYCEWLRTNTITYRRQSEITEIPLHG